MPKMPKKGMPIFLIFITMRLILLLLSVIVASVYSCTKQEDCPRYFQIPASIVPQQEEYHIGDTITMVSKFSRRVTAFNSEQDEIGTFDMKGIKWEPASAIYRIDTLEAPDQQNSKYSITKKYFDILVDTSYNYGIFTVSDGSTIMNGEYNYYNDTFNLTYQLVSKKAGIFYMENGSLVDASFDAQDFPGRCGRNGFDVWVKMNDGVDNNIHLMKESPDPHWNTWLISKEESYHHFSKLGGFCFRVVP